MAETFQCKCTKCDYEWEYGPYVTAKWDDLISCPFCECNYSDSFRSFHQYYIESRMPDGVTTTESSVPQDAELIGSVCIMRSFMQGDPINKETLHKACDCFKDRQTLLVYREVKRQAELLRRE